MVPASTSKVCVTCGKEKDLSLFHKHKACKLGYNTVCKECRKPVSRAQYKTISNEVLLYQRAKSRAAVRGLEFTIELSDIYIPELCPVFREPLERYGDYAPSLDRLDSSKGYTPENIKVISLRANILKNDATSEELRCVADWIDKQNYEII